MPGRFRRLFPALILLLISALPLRAQMPAPASVKTPAADAATDEVLRLLQLGQYYMGRNNPEYALKPEKVELAARNDAGEQAQRIFQQVTTRYPKRGDGWLWLGIALTETLHYSPKEPQGKFTRTAEDISEGVRAFRTAHKYKPDDIVCTIYYSEALMVFREDYDGARALWDEYLKKDRTDMQRVLALTQSARACLNKAYFGKIAKKLSAQDARKLFADAESYVRRAAGICPQAPDVKAMQALLEQYRTTICGK